MDKWIVLSSEYVVNNRPYHQTRKDRCRIPGGREIDYYVNEYADWVNAVVLTRAHQLVLLRQYRHGVRDFVCEIPGGGVDAGESPEAAIVREVLEETGYQSEQSPVLLGSFYPNPAISGNRVWSYLMVDAALVSPQKLDDTEDIEVQELPWEHALERVRAGRMNHLFSVAAIKLAHTVLSAES